MLFGEGGGGGRGAGRTQRPARFQLTELRSPRGHCLAHPSVPCVPGSLLAGDPSAAWLRSNADGSPGPAAPGNRKGTKWVLRDTGCEALGHWATIGA